MSFLSRLFKRDQPPKRRNPKTLLEVQCPRSPLSANVLQDDLVAYFFISAGDHPRFPTKACWLRNLVPAPATLEMGRAEFGNPPLLPAGNCRFPEGQAPLKASELEVVWFPTCDGAALLAAGEIIAIIPFWTGVNSIPPFARDCIGESPLCMEILPQNQLPRRIAEARTYWQQWEENPDVFARFQPRALAVCDETLGQSDQYYALDRGAWPQVGLYHRQGPRYAFFVTIGLSLRPQPATESYSETPERLQFMEFAAMLPNGMSKTEVDEFANDMGGLANYPWLNFAFFTEGHTANIYGLKQRGFEAVLFRRSGPHFPTLGNDLLANPHTNLLWVIPITTSERSYIMKYGSASFCEAMDAAGEAFFSWQRKPLA